MDKKVHDLMTKQLQNEFFSSYLYLDMANYYTDEGLDGFANWFYVQAQEEMSHAMMFRDYLLNNGEKIQLLPIEAPKDVFKDFGHPLRISLAHEKYVTSCIHNIYTAALEAQDYRTADFINWFIKEQGEEEKNSSDLIKKYELFGKEDKGLLFQLDKELATRVFVPPALPQS